MKIEISSHKQTIPSYGDVYVLDFDDNYHRLDSEPASEFERDVRKLKRRYRRVEEYASAIYLYKQWMNYLADIYGGKQLLKQKIKADVVSHYVPHKPKLKNSKSLKFLYKNGFIVDSKPVVINDEILDALISHHPVEYDITKRAEIVRDKDAEDILNTTNNIINKARMSTKSDIDFLDEYFKMKNAPSKKDEKHNKPYRQRLSDLMRDDYGEIEDTTEEDTIMLVNGRFMNASTQKELDVYHKINEIGWNSYKLMRKSNYQSNITKIFKKKSKSKKKEQKARDKMLIDIMGDNGYDDFESFLDDMEDFTSSNIFKG